MLFWVLLGMTVNIFLSSSAAAADHIELSRDIFIPTGHMAATPRALAQTKEGGYVVVGSIQDAHTKVPWAARVDRDGHLQWRYVPSERVGGVVVEDQQYSDVVTLTDDSTLFCGGAPLRSGAVAVAVLTHIAKTGKLIGERLFLPNKQTQFFDGGFQKCFRWGDGVAVVGDVERAKKRNGRMTYKNFYWIVFLNAEGDVRWSKLIPNDINFMNEVTIIDQAMVLANQDLVFEVNFHRIVSVGPHGSVNKKRISDAVELVHEVAPATTSHLFSGPPAVLRTFGRHLEAMGRMTGSAQTIATNEAYQLPDGSLVLFGDARPKEDNGRRIASIEWLSPDLDQRELFSFPASYWWGGVTAALPTHKQDEFVTARSVVPIPNMPERRHGVVLSFVHIK
ncbi:MAG: hypothetical protein B7Z66_14650 [Chromatiales bacterium 21-64-14]|nr:MAG: hypothetical protein B7Z66_14650 [Chromatiales bacterium 21-64-14]HQU17289.1 hypothetical protein [Gammaproteobacteria bacterium]